MSADRLTAGQTADGLVDHCLENRGGKVFFGCTVIDQWLDIGFGKNTAAGCDGVKCFIIFGIFVQTCSICL